MALKSVYAAGDEIPEAVKSLYSEASDGRFVLDVDDIDAHPKVRGAITALNEAKRKRDDYRRQVDDLTARVGELPEDFDASEWARLKAAGGKPDEALQAVKDQQARALDALRAKHKTEMDALAAQLAERDGYIDKTTRAETLRKALREVSVDPDFEEAVEAMLAGAIKVQRTDDGSRKAFAETSLGEVTVTDFVKEWASTKGQKFLAKPKGPEAHGGGGARGGAAKTITRAEFDKLDPAAQMKAMTVDKLTIAG